MASSIFEDMKGGWDDVCGGGTWWSKDRTYKNAIANELFLSVAAHLANRVSEEDKKSELMEWADHEWEWFWQSGMINAEHTINDGLNGNCKNNGGRVWTYNQGVVLGGLSELSRMNPDPSLPATAQAIALAAIEKLTDSDGVLHDPCEPRCGADGPQFKGIFARNLMALNDAFPDRRYARFAEVNARSIWNNARGPNNQLGLVWSGPFDGATAATQSSALDALVAAARMMQRFHHPEREDDDGNSPAHKRKADEYPG
jgi:predicted alpha-1,6-mannanase (GH76 family)